MAHLLLDTSSRTPQVHLGLTGPYNRTPQVHLGLTDPNATFSPYNGETKGDLKVTPLHLTWAHKVRKLSERTGVPEIYII